MLDALGRGALVALLVGVLVVTSEFRHQTVRTSLLQTPNRIQLVTAKSAASSLVGLALGLAALADRAGRSALLSGALQPRAGQLRYRAPRDSGLVLTYPLYALLGAAVGALLRSNQPLAVVIPVIWLGRAGGVRPVCRATERRIWSFLGTSPPPCNTQATCRYVLPVWVGAGALLATPCSSSPPGRSM